MLLTKAVKKSIPVFYETEGVEDPICAVKLFNPCGAGTWYIIEYDEETNEAYGYVELGESELGYFSITELAAYKGRFGLGIERDLYFEPTPLSLIKKEVKGSMIG